MRVQRARGLLRRTAHKPLHYQPYHPFSGGHAQLGYQTGYDRDGYVVIRALLKQHEISALRRCAQQVEEDAFEQMHNNSSRSSKGLHHFELDESTQQIRIARSERLIECYDTLQQLLCHSDLQSMMEQLFGEPVVLYKEKINYKYPHCGSFRAHQDHVAYPHIDRSIACAISIDDACEQTGCIQVAKGRHKEGVIGLDEHRIICDDIVENIEKRQKLIYECLPTQAGDAIVFDGYLPHRSGVNHTNQPRRILYATYNAKSQGDLRSKYYENKRSNQKEILVQGLSSSKHFSGNIVSTIGNE